MHNSLKFLWVISLNGVIFFVIALINHRLSLQLHFQQVLSTMTLKSMMKLKIVTLY
jgi:hypothetical protein